MTEFLDNDFASELMPGFASHLVPHDPGKTR